MKSERKTSRSSTFRWVSLKMAPPESNTTVVGFFSFEITALMSKLVKLWNRLKDDEFTTAKNHLLNSTGIEVLISNDEEFVMELFMKEIVEELQYIAKSISRFGGKCSDSVLHEFVKFVEDPLKNEFDWFGWQYKWKKMDRRVKKMQRFVLLTAELSREMEILAEVERNLRRSMAIFTFSGSGKLFRYRKKISLHQHHVQRLKLITPWNRTFDYILRLFMRSIITIIERIKILFGVKEIRSAVDGGENSTGRRVVAGNCYGTSVFEEQGKKQNCNQNLPLMKISSESKKVSKFTHFRSFRGYKHGGIGSPPPSPAVQKAVSLQIKNRASLSSPRRINGGHYSISSFFIKENVSNPYPNSLGAAALAIHYGKVVILIEKFASAPHLIGMEERDELFNMLSARIRTALRSRLRSAAKIRHSSLYDPVLGAEWKSAIAKILQWLAPMAHDMEKWHSEQSFEIQTVGLGVGDGTGGGGARSHVWLLQTLHYADREKTEAAIVELLVALSNICSLSEVYEKRLSIPIGVQARRSYSGRNVDFSYIDVFSL